MAKLKLIRRWRKSSYTIGELFYNGEYFSNTLEDPVRDYSKEDYKVYGDTAIPYGTYKVTLEWSPKFSKRYGNRKVPRLHNVPDFEGILIHSGNTNKDTSGCILVGYNTKKGMVTDSKNTLFRLLDFLDNVPKDEEISIEITK